MGKETKSKGGKKPPAENHAKTSAAAATIVSPTSSSPPSASKRPRNSGDLLLEEQQRRQPAAAEGDQAEPENLVFEDPFGDEFEQEEMDQEAEGLENIEEGAGDDDDVAAGDGATVNRERGAAAAAATAAGPSDSGMEVEGEEPRQEQEVQTKVWRAGVDELTEGEELEYDSTAYHMYHSLRPEWPCLSFDVIRDSLGANRSRFPHTIFAVAGTQADRAESNRLQVMRTVFVFLSGWR